MKSHTSQKLKSEIQSDEVKEAKKSVPIFALHPKGSHYIPLSVTEEVIQPYLHLFDQGSELPLMLHPITISVNFCGPIRIAAGVRSHATHLSHRTSQGMFPFVCCFNPFNHFCSIKLLSFSRAAFAEIF